MTQKISTHQFLSEIVGKTMHSHLFSTGCGSFNLDFRGYYKGNSRVNLRDGNLHHFLLARSDIKAWQHGGARQVNLQPELSAIWRYLENEIVAIWSSEGHGDLTLEFSRSGDEQQAIVVIRGGPSRLIKLPMLSDLPHASAPIHSSSRRAIN